MPPDVHAPTHLVHGSLAEQHAARYLQSQGLKVLQHNYRCRHGEIDLVLQDATGTLVFAEVRLRRRNDFGGAAASINPAKQRKLILAAHHYLARLDHVPACRFDAVLLSDLDGSPPQWIRNAFTA